MATSRRFIKVLCTLGPASLNASTVRRLEERNVDLFRINLSHTPLEKVAETIELIRSASSVPICLDTEGAQVRTGTMQTDVEVAESQRVRLTPEVVVGDAGLISLTPPSVFEGLEPGNLVGLDFDGVVLLVLAVDAEGADAVVLNGGRVGSNKAVVLTPSPALPAISAKDRAAVAIGRQLGIRHYALSFANSAADVRELRELVGPAATIISKIESKRAVQDLDDILVATDEILIDRGDLSRDVPLENIPLLQKAIIRKANLAKVPVNVATNLLESMIANRKPTRAELNDIINTLLDGANGLVLAAETAIGKHPVGTVDMVLQMIERFSRSVDGYRIEDLLEAGSTLAGRLGREPSANRRRSRISQDAISQLPAVEIDAETLLDVEQIVRGVYAPLRGFMTRSELESVLDDYRLPSGEAWPLPIVLQGKAQEFAAFAPGQLVRLVDAATGRAVAILHLEDKYEIDPRSVAERWFGTADSAHPGVRRFRSRGLTLLGGAIEPLPAAAPVGNAYELTPAQTRLVFDVKGWTKIVAFHPRSVPHRAHEHLIANACERSNADGLLILPAIGPKRPGDFSDQIVLGAYEQLIRLAFPQTLLAAFRSYERYSGARESVFSALCCRNFGCTHFVLGREHVDFAAQNAKGEVRELFEQLGDIGITPVFFNTVYFSDASDDTVEDVAPVAGLREISGTQIRQLLASHADIPAWCMRNELASWLVQENAGLPLFVTD